MITDDGALGAIGAWLGPMNAVWVGLYAGAAGGILAIFVALTKGYLIQAVGNVGVMLAYPQGLWGLVADRWNVRFFPVQRRTSPVPPVFPSRA